MPYPPGVPDGPPPWLGILAAVLVVILVLACLALGRWLVA